MAIKTGFELAEACMDVAKNYRTLYVMGCFGAPLTAANKKRYTSNHSYNKKAARKSKINAATADTFGFDCVNLIKGLLWGWDGDKSHTYGGASYASAKVPDIGADRMIEVCNGLTSDFSTIQVGEVVWLPGHIGVYVGNGLAVECSPKWADSVQVTAVGNVPHPRGYNVRSWSKHGKLPYISYTQPVTEPAPAPAPTTKKEGTPVNMQSIKRGDKHPHVRVLQALLRGFGYKPDDGSTLAVDGSYGPKTEQAVRKYQAKNKDTDGKQLDDDGKCGPKTWGSILAQ